MKFRGPIILSFQSKFSRLIELLLLRKQNEEIWGHYLRILAKNNQIQTWKKSLQFKQFQIISSAAFLPVIKLLVSFIIMCFWVHNWIQNLYYHFWHRKLWLQSTLCFTFFVFISNNFYLLKFLERCLHNRWNRILFFLLLAPRRLHVFLFIYTHVNKC